MQKLLNNKTKLFCWITQGGEFNTNYSSKVKHLLLELDLTKIVTWNFHVDDSQVKHGYNTMLGRDILSERQYVYVSTTVQLG